MPMRIMYFLDNGQSFGGAANTLLQQAVLMKQAGCDALLVISYYKNDRMNDGYYDICKNSGINMKYLPFQISSHIEDIDLICMLDNYHSVLEAVREYQPDILHSIQINPIVELVSRELGIPHIMNIYQALPEFFLPEYTDVFPKYHICDSILYANIWAENIHCDSVCIRTVVNCKNTYCKRDYGNRELIYYCVGRITERKNQLEVIKAFEKALLNGINGKLYLYGQDADDYADICKQYVVTHNLSDKVIIAGFCENMEAEYAKADVLICGSVCESYPNVISEALANGLIVVSTPVAGVPEVIADGVNGYLSEDFTGDSICEKLLQMNIDIGTDKIEKIQKNSYETYKRYHSPESVTKELKAYYQGVLSDYSLDDAWFKYADVRRNFCEFLNVYYANRNEFVKVENVKNKLWYIYHMYPVVERLVMEEKKKVYIWGTGKFSQMAIKIMEIFFGNIHLAGFIDTYKTGEYNGLKIYSPSEILCRDDAIVFVGVMQGKEEIIKDLNQAGMTCNQDYFLLVPRRW